MDKTPNFNVKIENILKELVHGLNVCQICNQEFFING